MAGHLIWVSGDVQKYGYRRRVVAMAKALGIKGLVMTLPDGRVKIMAEGEEADLERFEEALKMKKSSFKVTGVEVKRVDLPVDVDDFYLALSQTGGGAPRSRTAGHASRRRLSRPGL